MLTNLVQFHPPGSDALNLKKNLIINFKNILTPKGIKYHNNNTFLIQNIIDKSVKQHWRISTFSKFINTCNIYIMRIELEKVRILDWYNLNLNAFGKQQEFSINKAKKSLRKLNVNICDIKNNIYKNFESVSELKKYTKDNKLYCNKKEAKESGLGVFLKEI